MKFSSASILTIKKFTRHLLLTSLALPALSLAQEPIKIAYIDPQSGTFASQGESGYLQADFAADYFVNSKGGLLHGRQLEVYAFDNKNSAADAQIQLRRAISEGIQIVFTGNSSAVASALSTAISRHNRRNPESRVLLLNHAAVDPALTEEDCSFWHFRFDSHSDMKMQAMTDHIALNPDISKVYLIGQDYSFGKAVADAAIRMLAEKRPDIEIVGNELHPIGQVKDFTPYVTKIVSSGADAIITGNWGADMVALGRGIIDSGLEVPIYTFYAAYDGITATLGEEGKGLIRLTHNDISNPRIPEERLNYTRAFKEKYPHKDVTEPRIANIIMMMSAAIEKAQSADPYDIALALEDMHFTTFSGEDVWMRPDDHQIIQNVHVSVHTDEGITIDADNSGFGFRTEFTLPAERAAMETSCNMRRPRP
ncbi:MAG: branched-chain amino acid ABC transporter substrate-binding protein [Pseudohongiellaceae bacterium]|nr:branched-chain amino acid ABC transporter substrate-binding protein [Pseudohongiellaceae bacterium]